MWEKSKRTTECDKRFVIYDVGTAQCENGTVKYEKKVRDPPNVTKELSHGTAQCEDETIKCEKKVREPSNVTKELSHVMLELHNVRLELSNVRKK